MNTQFCSHTTDGTICDQCMGTTKGPEPWSRYGNHADQGDTNPHTTYYLAAPVEASMKEIKAVLEYVLPFAIAWLRESADAESVVPQEISEAQRLLDNWPIKEDA